MHQKKEIKTFPMLINILVCTLALFSYYYLGLMWPLYITMGILSMVIILQTLAASAFFAFNSVDQSEKLDNRDNPVGLEYIMISLALCLAYFGVIYQLYLLEFVIFASIAATHVAIATITNFIRLFII
jgi:hypothetical protein